VGDFIRFSAGANIGEAPVIVKIDGDLLYLSIPYNKDDLTQVYTAADEFITLRPTNLSVDVDGNLVTNTGPVRFIRDAAEVEVTEDTVDPANNIPLPVKLTSVTGDINITANDLNVQTSHTSANPDSMRIGDGVEEWQMNAAGEGLVRDADSITELQAILAKIIAAPATEAKQDTIITELQQIEAIVDLNATEAKQDAMITELQAILAKIIAAPATEAKQDAMITELQAILAKIIAAPATEAKQDDTITAIGNLQTAITSDVRRVIESTYVASVDLSSPASIGSAIPNGQRVRQVELSYQDGVTVEIFSDNGTTSLGMVTQGGGKIDVDFTSNGSNQIYVEAKDAGAGVVPNLMLNLIA